MQGIANLFNLHPPRSFGGLGNGAFAAAQIAEIDFGILGVWCRQPVYVVPDSVLDPEHDILAGHDFMQRFHISLDMTHDRIIAKRSRLKSANRVL